MTRVARKPSCCVGGYGEMEDDDKIWGEKAIFDCTCRNTSISSMKPAWNASLAQFPTEKYKNLP